jgi:hypothetical protein
MRSFSISITSLEVSMATLLALFAACSAASLGSEVSAERSMPRSCKFLAAAS